MNYNYDFYLQMAKLHSVRLISRRHSISTSAAKRLLPKYEIPSKRTGKLHREKSLLNALSNDILSIYDGTISQQVIQEKIKALEVGTKLAAAKVKFENEDYDSVINDLSHFVEDLTDAERAGTDLYETFLLLFESYKKTNDITNAWNCQLRAFDWLVTKLIEYACRQMQTTILKKDQDTEFFKFLKRVL